MADRSAVLFDIDGTLVDSNYFHAITWWQALDEAGHTFPMYRIHRLIGMGGDQITQTLLGHEVRSIADRHGELYQPYKSLLKPFDRAADLVREVSGRGATVALVSSAKEEDLEALLRALGADDAIDHVTTSADVDASKPAPDLFEVALSKAKVGASQAIAVGDSVWDVEAARRCGLECVCVLTGGSGRDELESAGALAVYDSAAALLDAIDSSPLARFLGAKD